MKRVVHIGLVGFGTVGKGVYDLISKNRDIIADRTGITLNIKIVCEKMTDLVKKAAPELSVTDNWKDLIADKEIETVVELIGGIEPARSIMLAALEAKKNVVTANKKLLAEA